jgi:hypothetical protein
LVDGKNSEDFFYFLHCFSTDQSEAKLLYFYSLFFSVKSQFKKQTHLMVVFLEIWDLTFTGFLEIRKRK